MPLTHNLLVKLYSYFDIICNNFYEAYMNFEHIVVFANNISKKNDVLKIHICRTET